MLNLAHGSRQEGHANENNGFDHHLCWKIKKEEEKEERKERKACELNQVIKNLKFASSWPINVKNVNPFFIKTFYDVLLFLDVFL